MGTALFVLLLTFYTQNNPPTAALAQEFGSLAACQRAGEEASRTFRAAEHIQVRFVCVPKG